MIINHVQKFRNLADLTQQELADLVGVSRQTIISIEKGSYNPTLELAFKLSFALNTGVTMLFEYNQKDS